MVTLKNWTYDISQVHLPNTKGETTPVDTSRPLVDPIVETNKHVVENKVVQINASPWGNAMPISIGARAVTGKIIWSSDLREVAQPEPADDTEQQEPHYEVDLAISFGKAIIDPAVRINTTLMRLWAQEVLCYNVAQDAETAVFARMSVTFHPGLIDAQPDATVQAAKGDLTPAWRNQLYVVIKNFPLWLVGLSDGLPDFVAEIFDKTDNGPTETNYTMQSPALTGSLHLLTESPLMFDAKRNVYYAWDTQNTLSTFDAETHTEISRVVALNPLLGSLAPDWVCTHDTLNQFAIVSDTIGNYTPLHLVSLSSGRVIRTLGMGSTSFPGTDILNPDPAQVKITFKIAGAPIQCSVQGVIIYGAVMGGIFDSVGVVYYAYDGSTFQLSDATNITGAGIGIGGDGNISGVCSYPIIGRKDLFPAGTNPFDDIGFKLGKNPNLKQDAYAFVSHGGTITMYRVGPDLVPGSPFVNNAVLHIKETIDIATFPGGRVDGMMVDPNDHNLIVFWHPSDKLDVEVTYMAKIKVLLSAYTQNADGTMSGYRPIISDFQYNVQLPRAMRAGFSAMQQREMKTWPLLGYGSSSGDFVEVDMATGATAYITPIVRGDLIGYVYNGKLGTVEVVNRGAGFVEHWQLRGATGEPMPLSEVIAALMQSAGYSPSQFNVDASINDTASGAMLDRSADLWSTMQNIGTAYDFMYYASGTIIKFKKPDVSAAAPAFAVDIDALYPSGGQPYDSITTTLASPDEVPGNTGITYIDKDQLYVSNTQTFRRTNFPVPVVESENDTTIPVPIVMHADEALRRSGMATFSQLVKGETVSFKLPVSYLAAEPVDIIQVTDGGFTRSVLVGEVVVSPDWCISVTGSNRNVRVNNRFRLGPDGNWITVGAPVFVTDPPTPPQRPVSTSPTDPVLLDVPLLTPAEDATDAFMTLFGGAASKVKNGWVGATVSTEFNDEPWATLMQTTHTMPLGRFVNPTLPPTDEPNQTDIFTVLIIDASNFDPTILTSVTDEQFRAGKNAVLIGGAGRWELVYYRDVSVVDNTVLLSTIARGQRGTDVFCNLHNGSDVALFVTTAGQRQLGMQSVVTSYTRVGDTFKVRARGTNFSGAVDTAAVAVEGNSIKPWAPGDPQARLGSLVNVVGTPAYTNPCGGGPFGGPNFTRRALIKVTSTTTGAGGVPENLVDGDFTSGNDHSFHIASGLTDLAWTFDFRPSGTKQIITALIYDAQGGAPTGCTFTVEASNDQVTWATLTTGIALASGTEYSWSNSTGYSFYRVRRDGGTSLNHVGHEFLFKTMADIANDDVLITWKRRDRLGIVTYTYDQPLSERTESYDLDIFKDGVKVRTVAALGGSGYTYTVADQSTDGFGQPLANLDVVIYQNGANIGRGLPREVTLDVKDRL